MGILLLLTVLIVAATSFAARFTYLRSVELEAGRLETMSDLRASRLASEVREKMAQTRFAGSSLLGELFLRWRDSGDPVSLARMTEQLRGLANSAQIADALVLDDRRRVLSGTGGAAQQAPAELLAAAQQSLADGLPHLTDPYGATGSLPAPRLDVVAPLTLSGRPPSGLVVLRLDPAALLAPLMRGRSPAHRSTRVVLARRQGDSIVDLAGNRTVPMSTPDLLLAKLMRGDILAGRAVEAADRYGKRVLGVVRPVAGTNWYLATMTDRDEIDLKAWTEVGWICAAGVMALLAAASAVYWFRDRQTLRLAHRAYALQQEQRLHLEQVVKERTHELAQKNAVLERSVADLEAFSYSISHDLRGSLFSISAFTSILQRSDSAVLSKEGRRSLDRIVAGTAMMDTMIQDILASCRADRVEMQLRALDLNDVVRDVLAEVGPGYPGTEVVVATLPVVNADPTLARQIFANLIGNALKFSSRQDRPLVEIGTVEGGDPPLIFVRDNGVGFDPAQAHKLFAVFERLHDSKIYPGTGVGLSIVKRVLERHGGSISARSEPGCTTFSFTFGAGNGRA